MSKPCASCLHHMTHLPPKYGFQIKNVVYSNGEGELVKIKLSHLKQQKNYVSSYFRRNLIINSHTHDENCGECHGHGEEENEEDIGHSESSKPK